MFKSGRSLTTSGSYRIAVIRIIVDRNRRTHVPDYRYRLCQNHGNTLLSHATSRVWSGTSVGRGGGQSAFEMARVGYGSVRAQQCSPLLAS